MKPPDNSLAWLGLSNDPLPAEEARLWVTEPHIGAVVTFSGVARNHSEGRNNVSLLEYEAYEDQVVPRMERIVEEARSRWPTISRIALLHRVGPVEIGEVAVIVAVGSPHRDDSFHAARFCIDTLKFTVPIWKREQWDEGQSWGLEPQHLRDIEESEQR
ncbi:MAG: molybdenum cofactor biosynthesis protein MoaE [Actinomycetota bacterium]|nr:molybdenum cofactor biosynthesis protein MoaE [Actinomycetota bacterium]